MMRTPAASRSRMPTIPAPSVSKVSNVTSIQPQAESISRKVGYCTSFLLQGNTSSGHLHLLLPRASTREARNGLAATSWQPRLCVAPRVDMPQVRDSDYDSLPARPWLYDASVTCSRADRPLRDAGGAREFLERDASSRAVDTTMVQRAVIEMTCQRPFLHGCHDPQRTILRRRSLI